MHMMTCVVCDLLWLRVLQLLFTNQIARTNWLVKQAFCCLSRHAVLRDVQETDMDCMLQLHTLAMSNLSACTNLLV